jgi:pimeloyl-ACP methyl ester carboxylesterase
MEDLVAPAPPSRRHRIRSTIAVVALVAAGLFAAFIVYVTVRPIGADRLVSNPDPAASYEEAVARWSEVEARDASPPEPLDPRCHAFARLHGERTATAVVLIHGYTNCPYGMERLAGELYDRGWNVIVPRLPHHGYADKLTHANGLLTSEDLVATADEAVDIADGLGERVVVGGLSAGGVAAAWVAQNRPDVDRVIALAPLANLRPLPGWFTPQVVNAVLTVPDIEMWWDGQKQASIPPDYGYPKLSTHAVASLIRLGMATLEQARAHPAGAHHVVLTVNANDGAVNPQTVEDLVAAWRANGTDATIYEWPAEWGLTHNMVDDVTNADKFDEVYPVLIDLFAAGE